MRTMPPDTVGIWCSNKSDGTDSFAVRRYGRLTEQGSERSRKPIARMRYTGGVQVLSLPPLFHGELTDRVSARIGNTLGRL